MQTLNEGGKRRNCGIMIVRLQFPVASFSGRIFHGGGYLVVVTSLFRC